LGGNQLNITIKIGITGIFKSGGNVRFSVTSQIVTGKGKPVYVGIADTVYGGGYTRLIPCRRHIGLEDRTDVIGAKSTVKKGLPLLAES
jgi:hypothetical protein